VRALLVDDEPLARRELRRLLSAHGWIQIVGEAGDIDEAQAGIDARLPALIFLDVEMPGGSGFDLLERLDRPPRVIFTTAYDQYAVKAFEVSALDYLLKPIEPARLAAALDKIRPSTSASAHGPCTPLEQLFVRDGLRCWFVPLREVSVFTAEGNYVRLEWGRERPLLGRSLSALESKLDSQRFFRANRQQIFNLEHIQDLELGAGGRLYVRLRDGREIEISRRQARGFRARMGV
jgi:two-component system LytT family response regulator